MIQALKLSHLDCPLKVDHNRFWLDHEAWVLHANQRNGCSVLHRLRELPDWGLQVEGVYSWN